MWAREKKVFLLIILIALLTLYGLQALSYNTHPKAFLFDETYYYLRISGSQSSSGINPVDELQGRRIGFNLFTYLSGKLGGHAELAARLFPGLMGVLSLLLFRVLLKRLGIEKRERILTLAVLAISPVFIHVFSSYTPQILWVPLLLTGVILYLKKSVFSTFLFGALPFISTPASIAAIFFLTAHKIFRKANKSYYYSVAIILAGFGAATFLLGSAPLQELALGFTSITTYVVEFGASKGYSLITFVLAIIGLMLWWSRDTEKTIAYSGLLLLIAASVFLEDIRILAFLFISFFSAKAILYLASREWNVKPLKNATLLLILCSLVFSFAVTANTSVAEASEERVTAIKYLESTPSNQTILSSERNGFMISYLSGRKAFLDGKSYKYPDYNERKLVADAIYYSRNLAELETLLDEHNITHFLIDQKMMQGEVWNSREEGVLLILIYNDEFLKMFDNQEIQVYKRVK